MVSLGDFDAVLGAGLDDVFDVVGAAVPDADVVADAVVVGGADCACAGRGNSVRPRNSARVVWTERKCIGNLR